MAITAAKPITQHQVVTRILLGLQAILERVGFAVLLLGEALPTLAQPYEPVVLYEAYGDTMEILGQYILEPLGDQNGDGFDDFLVNVGARGGNLRIVFGSNNSTFETSDFAHLDMDSSNSEYIWLLYRRNTGKSLCADYNSDGIVDVLLDLERGETRDTTYTFLFLGGGGPEEFDTLWDWRSIGTTTSHALTGLGDFNANGTPDFTRGWVGESPRIALWYFDWTWPDPPTEPTWVVNRPGPQQHSNFQTSQGVGDITGDGWPDMMYFVKYPDWSFHYEIWYGGPGADSIPDFQFIQDTMDVDIDLFGILGDVNGDGVDDIGAYVFDPFAPQTGPAIMYGGLPINVSQPDIMLGHNSGEQILPRDAQVVGDINDDGYKDVAYRDVNRGSCYLFLGGNPMDSLWSFYLPAADFEEFRTSLVRGIGDFNGDGIDDWAISAYEDFFTTPRRGRVVVFAGDRNWGVPVSAERPDIPHDFVLGNPYPNPFNSEVIIPLTISRAANSLDVSIYNTLGQLVYSFPDHHLTAGNTHFLRWNGMDNAGTQLASGRYFVRGSTGPQIQTVTITLIK